MIPAHEHLIRWGLARKYIIEVEIEGEVESIGTSFRDSVRAVEAGDVGCIYFKESDNEYLAGFSYVLEYDQEPDEIIGDWGVNDVSIAWDREYTEHCKQYPINKEFSRSNN